MGFTIHGSGKLGVTSCGTSSTDRPPRVARRTRGCPVSVRSWVYEGATTEWLAPEPTQRRKGAGTRLEWAELATRSRAGAWGSPLKALRRNELAAIREAKNALAVEGTLVGLRRFSPDADDATGSVNPIFIPPPPNAYPRTPETPKCSCVPVSTRIHRCDTQSDSRIWWGV